jgi:ankyrin repeat protein
VCARSKDQSQRSPEPSGPGNPPLLIAAAKGHTEAVKAPIAHSPEIDFQNKAGDTAFISGSRVIDLVK